MNITLIEKNKLNAENAIKEAKERKIKEVIILRAKEKNGPKGLEPTRYGDWEKSGRCIDFKNGNKNED